jgi:hypothetical protein
MQGCELAYSQISDGDPGPLLEPHPTGYMATASFLTPDGWRNLSQRSYSRTARDSPEGG